MNNEELLDEQQVRALVVTNQRSFQLNERQRNRLRSRLQAQPVESEREAILPDETFDARTSTPLFSAVVTRTPSAGSPRGQGSASTTWWLVAAIAVLVFGAASLTIQAAKRDDPTIQTAATATTSAESEDAEQARAAAFCAGELASFGSAVEAWAGIENWSYLTDTRKPEPDLARLALDALDALAVARPDIEMQDIRNDLLALRDEDLETASTTANSRSLSGAERLAHQDGVRSAATFLRATIDADELLTEQGCRLDQLDE